MDTLIKQPNENILFDMDMEGIGRLSAGDTIASVTSVTADGVGLNIIGATTDNTTLVQFRAFGGVTGTTYKVTAIVATVGGDTLEGEGLLRVVDL